MGEEGSRHTDWDRTGFILHEHAQILLPAALATPASGGEQAGTPLTPLGSPGCWSTSIHQPEDAQGWGEKRLRPLKSSSARCSTRERCRPELHTGHVLPSRGLREDFPFLAPAPGHSSHPDPSLRAHPVLWGDARASLPGAFGVGSPFPGSGHGQERCPRPSFPGGDEGVCFAGNGETADGRARGERGFSSRRCPHSTLRALINRVN